MQNTIADGAFRQLWMDGVQEDLDKALVAKAIATVDTRATRIFHNPFNSTPVGSNGAKQVSYTAEAMTSTDDTLTVNQRATAAEQIDNYEELMTSYDLMSQQAQRQAYRISDYIDQFILNLPVSKSGVKQIDNGYISSGVNDNAGYAISSSNANTLANAITEMLALGNAQMNKGLYWVVSPYDRTAILAYAQSHGFNVADSAITQGMNGSTGKNFGNLDLYVSNNLTHTVTFEMATKPTANDTVTLVVNGHSIKFKFVTSPANAGEVAIGSADSNSQANLNAAINGTGVGDGTDYFELAAADRLALKMVAPQSAPGTYAICSAFATNVATLTTYGSLKVASSLTAGSPDGFGTVIRTIALALVNTVTSTATALKTTGRSLTDSATYTDTFAKIIGYVSTLTETLTYTDTLIRTTARLFTETASATASALTTTARALTESVTSADVFSSVNGTVKTLSETITASAVFARISAFTRALTEAPTLVDSFTGFNGTIKTFSEVVAASDALIRSMTKALAEAVTNTASSIASKVFARTYTETTTSTASLSKTTGRGLADTFTLTDAFTRALSATRTLSESVGFTDLLKKLRNGSDIFLKNIAKHTGSLINQAKHSAALSTIAKHVAALRNKEKS